MSSWRGHTQDGGTERIVRQAFNSILQKVRRVIFAGSGGVRSDAAIVAILIALLIGTYLSHPNNPSNSSSDWFSWWDQSQYFKSAQALAQGDFDPASHWYPIGYALLGVPGMWVGLKDPFLPVSLGSMLFFGLGMVRLFEPTLGRTWSGMVAIISLIVPFYLSHPFPIPLPYIGTFAEPWNTAPIAAATVWILHFLVKFADGKSGRWSNFGIGALAIFITVIKPVDAVMLVPAAAYFVYLCAQQRQWQAFLMAAVGGAAMMVLPLCMHLAIYGLTPPDYFTMSKHIGFSFGNLEERFFGIFYDATATYSEPFALAKAQFWLYGLVPLSLAAMWYGRPAIRLVTSTAAISIILYLSYNDFTPMNMIRFRLVHYIVWTFPILLGVCLVGIVLLWRNTGLAGVAAAIISSVALAIVQLAGEPVFPQSVVAADSKAGIVYTVQFQRKRDLDAIDFPGSHTQDWTQLTLLETRVEADGVQLKLFKDYRFMVAENGVRLIFNRDLRTQTLVVDLPHATVVNAPIADKVLPLRFQPISRIGNRRSDTRESQT